MSFASSAAFSPPLAETPPVPKRTKSPPMAFERTSNDALAPRISPPFDYHNIDPFLDTSSRIMSPIGSPSSDLRALVHKQSEALDHAHKAFAVAHSAFAVEREAWRIEKDGLYARIASFEQLLATNGGHSPAKSPTMSPNNGSNNVTSPPTSRLASATLRLPSIAEDENVEPRTTLSKRREGAPCAIEIPSIDTVAGAIRKPRNNSVVSFSDEHLKIEEIPCSSPRSMMSASPIPEEYKVHAGHTPNKTPARPLTPLAIDMASSGIEETPTKHNTQTNATIASRDSEDEDHALTGPLSMPELPNQPGEHNFTEEMLIKRLNHIAQSPGTERSRPLIFSTPTPGLATPEASDCSPKVMLSNRGGVVAPASTHELPTQPGSAMSPQSGIPLSQVTSNDELEAAVQRDFDQGGIKLKKKASSNFGAPFGTLGGYSVPRRLS